MPRDTDITVMADFLVTAHVDCHPIATLRASVTFRYVRLHVSYPASYL